MFEKLRRIISACFNNREAVSPTSIEMTNFADLPPIDAAAHEEASAHDEGSSAEIEEKLGTDPANKTAYAADVETIEIPGEITEPKEPPRATVIPEEDKTAIVHDLEYDSLERGPWLPVFQRKAIRPKGDDDESIYQVIRNSHYYHLVRNYTLGEPQPRFASFGWKFHVAIDDHDHNNLRIGVMAVTRILIEASFISFKFYRRDASSHLRDHECQCGKQFVVYVHDDLDRAHADFWGPIMDRIDSSLTELDIKPGPLPPGNYTLQDSRHITYRYSPEDEPLSHDVRKIKQPIPAGMTPPIPSL